MRCLRALTEQLPPTGYVLTYNYTDGSIVSIRTQFETLEDLNAFQRSLMTDERFLDVKLLGVTTELKADVDAEEEENALEDEPLPRYIGEFTFTFQDVEDEVTEEEDTDEEVVSQ